MTGCVSAPGAESGGGPATVPTGPQPSKAGLEPATAYASRIGALLIEPIERRSSCRYVIQGALGDSARRSAITVLLVGYRGSEIACHQGLERLNLAGADFGIVFIGARSSPA
jgi:hypothetical protein